jgi:hypothetical protein
MEAGMNIDGSLTEVGRLRLEKYELQRKVYQQDAFIDSLKDSLRRVEERAKDNLKLADARLEWAVKLEQKVATLRARIVVLSDQKAGCL